MAVGQRYYAVRFGRTIRTSYKCAGAIEACHSCYEMVSPLMRVKDLGSRKRQVQDTFLFKQQISSKEGWTPPMTNWAGKAGVLSMQALDSPGYFCRKCNNRIVANQNIVLVDNILEPDIGLTKDETAWVHEHCPLALAVTAESEPENLQHWTEILREVEMPAEFLPAIACCRPQLLALIKPRVLSEEECFALVGLIRTLLETNDALRQNCAAAQAKVREMWKEMSVLRDVTRRLEAHFEDVVDMSMFGADPS